MPRCEDTFKLLIIFFQLFFNVQLYEHHIDKRTLLAPYPPVSVLQITMGLSCPAILPSRSITLSMCAQFNHDLPYNTSNFFPTVIQARNFEPYEYDIDRYSFYNYVIDFIDGMGFKGKVCLLRAICEASYIPIDTDDNQGVLEKILHYILTPSEDFVLASVNVTTNGGFVMDDYLRAEHMGKLDGNCLDNYLGCDISLMEMWTKLFYVN